MTEVNIGDNESFESMLKRFTRKVQQGGVLSEVRRRGFFEKPSLERKHKRAAKKRKSARIPRTR